MRDYQFLMLGNAMTFAGFQVRQMAIAWLVLEQTESSLKAGIVNAMPGISIICLSLFAGAVTDRSERRGIIVWARFVITALLFLSAALVAADLIQWWHFIPIGLGIGMTFAFHNPASQSYAMDVVGRERLISAASINTAISNLANIAAPALGGVLLGLGLEWAFWLLVVLYGTSFLAIFPVRKRTVPSRTARSILADMRAGLKYVNETPAIKWLLLLGLGSIFNGVALAMLPIFARSVFNVGEVGYGTMLTVQGVGSLAGAILLTLTGDVRRKGLLVIFNMMLSAGALTLFALSPWYGLALGALFMAGVTQGITFITVPTVIQTHSAPEVRGRVMGIFFMVVLVFQLGWVVGGVLDSTIGSRPTAAIAAGGLFGLAVLALAASPPLRRLT
jgi:MFS family permease